MIHAFLSLPLFLQDDSDILFQKTANKKIWSDCKVNTE